MHATSTSVAVFVLGGILTALAGSQQTPPAGQKPFRDRSTTSREKRLSEIDSQLAQLANYSLGGGIGAIGYRSAPHETPDHPEWIEIEFDETVSLKNA